MAAHCIRKLAFQTLQTKTGYACWYLCPESSRQFTTFLVQTTMKVMIPQSKHITPCQKPGLWTMLVKKFTTTDVGEGETETAQHREKKHPRARRTLGSIGRKIHHRIIQVIDENGENLGNLHRGEVIRLMDEHGVKVVPLRENTDPPVYKLMTGKQIHEEQMKLREKQKNKSNTGPCQIKEQTFSADIAKHDLQTKIKQIQQWIEKKHHVRITVRKGTVVDKADKMEILLEEIVQSMHNKATYVSKPKVIKEGKAAMCILRHISEKELRAYKQKQGAVSKHNCISSKEEDFKVAKKDHEQQNGAPSFATTQMNELSLGNRAEEKKDTTKV